MIGSSNGLSKGLMKADQYKDQIRGAALDDETLVRLTLKGKLHGAALDWRQIIVRPVLIKNERHLQFSYFSERQDITKNYCGTEAAEKLEEALTLPFGSIHLQTTVDDWHVQMTRKGTPILHRNVEQSTPRTAELAHNREKALPLPADRPDAFLQTVGIMDAQGKVRPAMHAKFAQVNEFLKLLEHTGELERFEHTPVNILDCGCGAAYLSFAAYHYLNDVRGIPARLTGIDVNGVLIARDNQYADQLGYAEACFNTSAIIDYVPDVPPDILLALHACDTATDEAIAQGIRHQSRLILCAPCCHHQLRGQLHTVAPFAPVMRHGILEQRLSDLLTDSFRALILRIMGYKTDVVEFVSPEHTDKNLMIRAVRRADLENATFIEEYNALKAFWGVTPYLETLLGGDQVFESSLRPGSVFPGNHI